MPLYREIDDQKGTLNRSRAKIADAPTINLPLHMISLLTAGVVPPEDGIRRRDKRAELGDNYGHAEAASLSTHASAPPNLELSAVPSANTVAAITTAMRATIRPYSTAVAPSSFLRARSLRTSFNT